jgi:nucleotide sugar dehydrogenase
MKIGIVGTGKLGLCLALNLNKAGHDVSAFDVDERLVSQLNARTFKTSEPFVEQYLASSTMTASCDLQSVIDSQVIFIVLPTPSKQDGSYDHELITGVLRDLRSLAVREKIIVISSTVMPGYCSSILDLVASNHLCYNPEFIAQGSIIADQQNQDMILVGGKNAEAMKTVAKLQQDICGGKTIVRTMSFEEAETVKLATNVFLTMKIAYANKVGDMVTRYGGDPDVVLEAIGDDKRINQNCLRYGFGYGGPCLPRDNKAFIHASEAVNISAELSKAVDQANQSHLDYLVEDDRRLESLVMGRVTFKSESTILECSQRLQYAVALADAGVRITICERPEVIAELRKMYGDKFKYAIEE